MASSETRTSSGFPANELPSTFLLSFFYRYEAVEKLLVARAPQQQEKQAAILFRRPRLCFIGKDWPQLYKRRGRAL
jgi:hypothetical protein